MSLGVFAYILVSLCENFCLVLLNVSDVLLANRDVVLQVEVIINALTMASSHQKYLIKNDFINYFLRLNA